MHNPKTLKRWSDQHRELLDRIRTHYQERGIIDINNIDDEDHEEDSIPDEFKKKIEKLDDQTYNVAAIIMDALLDMDQLAKFMDELKDFNPDHDDKLQKLIDLLQSDPILKKHKVLIFTEYRATARYLAKHLKAAGIEPLVQVDGQKQNASATVYAFSPYYNESNSVELAEHGIQEIRVLVSTDVLAEGLTTRRYLYYQLRLALEPCPPDATYRSCRSSPRSRG